jgi:hypothetical protein
LPTPEFRCAFLLNDPVPPWELITTLIFELPAQTICSSWFSRLKTRAAEELEIVTVLCNVTPVKRTLISVLFVPGIEKGRVIGWMRELALQTVLLGETVTGPRSRLHTVRQYR